MINPRNNWSISGNLARDAAKVAGDKMIEMTVAVNGAGNTLSDPAFVTAKVWLTESEYNTLAVSRQVQEAFDKGELVKGARVNIVGPFRLETWDKDGVKGSKPCIMIEGFDHYTSSANRSSSSSSQMSDESGNETSSGDTTAVADARGMTF